MTQATSISRKKIGHWYKDHLCYHQNTRYQNVGSIAAFKLSTDIYFLKYLWCCGAQAIPYHLTMIHILGEVDTFVLQSSKLNLRTSCLVHFSQVNHGTRSRRILLSQSLWSRFGFNSGASVSTQFLFTVAGSRLLQ